MLSTRISVKGLLPLYSIKSNIVHERQENIPQSQRLGEFDKFQSLFRWVWVYEMMGGYAEVLECDDECRKGFFSAASTPRVTIKL